MPRHVNRIDGNLAVSRPEEADEIATNMAGRLEQKRDCGRAKIPKPITHQRLLHLARLVEITVERIVEAADFFQRHRDQPVLVAQFPFHLEHPVAGIDPGAQLFGIDRFAQKIVRPNIKPLCHRAFLALRGQQDEIDVSVQR